MSRDPYLRAWVKVPTYVLEQERYGDLTFEQFGIFVKAILFSTGKSKHIGYFLDRETGEPMNVAHIARRTRPDVGDSAEWERKVFHAFERFVATGLMEREGDEYVFASSVIEQFLNENNLESRRKYERERKAKRRADERASEKAERPGPNVVPLKPGRKRGSR